MSFKKHVIYVGKVISDKMEKSRVVIVRRKVRHSIYNKVLTKNTKFLIHDPVNISTQGDIVSFKYIRPISKTKCWKILDVLKKHS